MGPRQLAHRRGGQFEKTCPPRPPLLPVTVEIACYPLGPEFGCTRRRVTGTACPNLTGVGSLCLCRTSSGTIDNALRDPLSIPHQHVPRTLVQALSGTA